MFDDIVSGIASTTQGATALAAVVGIILGIANWINSNKQIKLTNKHFMYERRVNSYVFLTDLITLFSLERNSIIDEQKKDEAFFGAADLVFQVLTNTSRLSDLIIEYLNPLDNVDEHKKYLTMIEKFRSQGQMVEFEFYGESGEIGNEFIQKYFDFISQLMKYKILYKKITEYNKGQINLPDGQREKQLEIFSTHSESKYRKRLFDSFNELDKAYLKIIDLDLLTKLKKQTSPIR